MVILDRVKLISSYEVVTSAKSVANKILRIAIVIIISMYDCPFEKWFLLKVVGSIVD